METIQCNYLKRDIIFNKKLFSFTDKEVENINSQIIDGYKAIYIDAEYISGRDIIFYGKNKAITVDDTEAIFNDGYIPSDEFENTKEDDNNSTLTFYFLCLENKKPEWGSIMEIPLNQKVLVLCSDDYMGIGEKSTGNLTEDELNFLLN